MGKLTFENGVKKYEYREGGSTFVGEWDDDLEREFMVGAYSFSNVYSANMFAYLFRKTSPAVADKTTRAWESRIRESGAWTAFKDVVSVVDWKAVATGNVPGAIFGTVKNVTTAALGSAFQRVTLNQAYPDYNKNEPTLTNNKQYIEYALKYWLKFPDDGPAYKLFRDVAPRVRR